MRRAGAVAGLSEAGPGSLTPAATLSTFTFTYRSLLAAFGHMKKRVLIISTSAGTGHVRAAQALEKEFKGDPRVGEVIHEDALNFTNKIFREFYSTLYMKLVRSAPELLGWVYKAS